MLLVIDIGNTNITYGIYCDNNLVVKDCILTTLSKPDNEYAISIIELFINKKIDCLKIDNVIIASVVPSLNEVIKNAIKKFVSTSTKINIIGQDKVKLNIINKTTRPSEVGHDRLINAIAAHNVYTDNLIIIDFGTAITLDVVANNGDYLGGIILPGLNISLKALHENTSKLPLLKFRKPSKVIGTGTNEAILSGIYHGFNSSISGLVKKIEDEYGKKMTRVFTGGQAFYFKDLIDNLNGFYEPSLTLNGLKIIHDHNIIIKK